MTKIKKILKKINFIKILIVELYLVIAQLVWHCKEYVLIDLMKLKQNTIPYFIYVFGIGAVLTIVLIALIITLKRFNINKKKETKGMQDVDLKNNNDEYVSCKEILDGNEENQKIYVLDAKNISLEKMIKRWDDLEVIYDIKIDYMEYGKTTKTINVYCTPRKLLAPRLFDVWAEDHFLDDFLSALIVGSTGSGKTYFGRQLLGKVVYNKDFISEKVKVFICDRKNEDYIQFKNFPNYYGINAVDGIRKVHKILKERMESDESNDNEETIILLIEEYGVLINMLETTKEKEEVKTYIENLLFAGRSKKIITIVSLQRADAEYFRKGSREQFKKVIMMGQISQVQLDMLLDNEDLQKQITEINPQGYGYLYEHGKRKLTRIKVAEITQEDMNKLDEIIGEKMV